MDKVFNCNGQSPKRVGPAPRLSVTIWPDPAQKEVLLDSELKVGHGWRYQCKSCDYQVKVDKVFPEKCPGCGTGGWWGHLTSQNGVRGKNLWDKILKPVKTRSNILSQPVFDNDNDVLEHNGPGRKPLPLDGIVKELASQGMSSRGIAAALIEQGINVSYKTIQRRLQASLL